MQLGLKDVLFGLLRLLVFGFVLLCFKHDLDYRKQEEKPSLKTVLHSPPAPDSTVNDTYIFIMKITPHFLSVNT